MNKKMDVPKGVRHIQIVEYFLFAKAPIHEYDFIQRFGVSINSLLHDIAFLRKKGFLIGSSRGYYELQNKIMVEDIQKLTAVSDKMLDWMMKQKRARNK